MTSILFIMLVIHYICDRVTQLGIYEDFVRCTYQSYPGSMECLEKYAAVFGDWETDSLTLDSCNIMSFLEQNHFFCSIYLTICLHD